MSEHTHVVWNLLTQPSQIILPLKEKSSRILTLLLFVNGILNGFNYSVSHFQVNFAHWIFWLLVLGVGLLSIVIVLTFIGIYTTMARGMKERDLGPVIKVISFDFILPYTLLNLVAVGPILLLYSAHLYSISVWLYDLSHLGVLLWIGALAIQALQVLRKESETRSCFKVFLSLFGTYCIATLLYLWLSALLISNIIR